ncbi:hypothetical protein [Streptomyces sp. 184]|uniref:hypothetical protein n=1 Tax=Streptomyces sp. 184 TaxID=1827526 RepID=UPI0038913F02
MPEEFTSRTRADPRVTARPPRMRPKMTPLPKLSACSCGPGCSCGCQSGGSCNCGGSCG